MECGSGQKLGWVRIDVLSEGRANVGEQREKMLVGLGEPHVLTAPKPRVRWEFRVATTFPRQYRPGYLAQGKALTRWWACLPESRS